MAIQTIDCNTVETAMQYALEDILTYRKVPDQETLALIPAGEMSEIIRQLSKNPTDEITTRKVFSSLVPDHPWLSQLRSKPLPVRNGENNPQTTSVQERSFQLYPLSYFKNKPQREWLCHNIVYTRSTSIFYGDSGSGKSTFVLDMFLSCATAVPFVNRATKPAFLIWVAGESSDDLYPRAKAFLLCKNMPEEQCTNFLGLDRHMPFDSPSEVLDFITDVKEQLVEMGVSSESHSLVLVFDTYAKCTPNSDENGTQDTKVITASIDAIVKELACHVSIIHHANAQSRMRGNTAFKASVDTVWFASKEKDTMKLHCEKMRGTKEPDDLMVEVRSIVIDEARMGELDATAPVIFSPHDTQTEVYLPHLQSQILEILKAHGKLTCNQWQKYCEDAHQISRSVFYRTRKSVETEKLIATTDDKTKGKSVYYMLTSKGFELLDGSSLT